MYYPEQFEFVGSQSDSFEKKDVFEQFPAADPHMNAPVWQSFGDLFATESSQEVDSVAGPPLTPSLATVSPAELLSTASTVNHCFSDIDHTPLIESLDFPDDSTDWTPLFDPLEVQQLVPARSENTLVPLAPREPSAEPESIAAAETPSFAKALAMEVDRKLKKKSVVGSSRSRASKVDSMGITAYNRKPRAAPLKPVEVPVSADCATAKRARNTEAARRSRARKMERMGQLEERVHELIREKEELEAEVCRLKAKYGVTQA